MRREKINFKKNKTEITKDFNNILSRNNRNNNIFQPEWCFLEPAPVYFYKNLTMKRRATYPFVGWRPPAPPAVESRDIVTVTEHHRRVLSRGVPCRPVLSVSPAVIVSCRTGRTRETRRRCVADNARWHRANEPCSLGARLSRDTLPRGMRQVARL